VKSKKV